MQDIRPPSRSRVSSQNDRPAVRLSASRRTQEMFQVSATPQPAVAPVAQKPAQPISRLRAEKPPHQFDHLATQKHVIPNGSTEAKKSVKSDRFARTKKIAYIICVLLLSAAVVYFAYDAWVTNARIKESLGVPVVDNADPESRQAAEGRDETDVTENTLANYTVAADAPRLLAIDTLNVQARVLPMEVNPDNSMQAPLNIYDSGWYTGSAKPGQAGAMVIDGHASGPTREGLFAYLDTLKTGDTIAVERGDGKTFTYTVRHTETVALEDVDMQKLLRTYDGAEQGLNLITCAGAWMQDEKTFNQRTMVYATP